MANQELYNKQYKIPNEILDGIRKTLISNPNGEGVKRAKFMLNNGYITYQAMKRLKNFFDYFNPQTDSATQYNLAGGQPMKTYVDNMLNTDRNVVKTHNNIRREIMPSDSGMNPHEEMRTDKFLQETKKKEKDKNVVAVIVNEDNKILLLKRGEGAPWMPSKYSLVGGRIDKGETPQKAIEREIMEETGLDINKFIKSFTIERHADSIEHVFACRYDGDPTDIVLDDENSNYGWYDVSEMEYLDTVPHLIEYITLVFKKYD